MSAPAFDPDAIAARVVEREHQQPVHVAPTSPLARVQGSCVTGTGDARGLPVPTEAIRPLVDLETRIEQARQRRAVQSPFGPPDQRPAPPKRRQRVAERFIAPDMDDEEFTDAAAEPLRSTTEVERQPELVRGPVSDVQAPADHALRAGVDRRPRGNLPRGAGLPMRERDGDPGASHDPRCGQPLTGGGAPRGWILIRIIGQGRPRRYCSPACASTAILAPPADLQDLQEVVAAAQPEKSPTSRSEPRQRKPRASSIDAAEIIRRYRDGATVPQIAAAGLASIPSIRRILRAAFQAGTVEKRDDRAGNSGSAPKDYDPELVARVRRLYTLHGLTQGQVAEQIGSSTKVVQNIMARHGIEARPDAVASPVKVNNSQRIGQRLTELGLTNAIVRAWALDNGHVVGPRGSVPTRLIDAYLAAHTPAGQTA